MSVTKYAGSWPAAPVTSRRGRAQDFPGTRDPTQGVGLARCHRSGSIPQLRHTPPIRAPRGGCGARGARVVLATPTPNLGRLVATSKPLTPDNHHLAVGGKLRVCPRASAPLALQNHPGEPRGRIVGFGHNTAAGTEQPGSSRPRSRCRAPASSVRVCLGAHTGWGLSGLGDRWEAGDARIRSPARPRRCVARQREIRWELEGRHAGLRDLRPRLREVRVFKGPVVWGLGPV